MFKKINWKYALGEIIIVIIGITIAFSLNKCSENVKNQSLRKQYLESLLLDLESEIAHFEENINAFEAKKEDINQIRPFLYGKQEGRDSMVNKIFMLANIIHFQPNDITYKTLVNSGNLSLFNNFELQKAMERHYSYHQVIQLDYERQNKIHEKYLGNYMVYELDYDKIWLGNFSFMDDQILKNIIQSLFGTYHLAIQASQKGISNCESLRNLLQEELEDN